MQEKQDWQGFRQRNQYCPCGKRKYDKRGAVTAKNACYKDRHVHLRIYQCELSGGWHLTKLFPHRKDWLKKRSD